MHQFGAIVKRPSQYPLVRVGCLSLLLGSVVILVAINGRMNYTFGSFMVGSLVLFFIYSAYENKSIYYYINILNEKIVIRRICDSDGTRLLALIGGRYKSAHVFVGAASLDFKYVFGHCFFIIKARHVKWAVGESYNPDRENDIIEIIENVAASEPPLEIGSFGALSWITLLPQLLSESTELFLVERSVFIEKIASINLASFKIQ